MPSGRSNTVLAVVLSLVAVGFAAVAIEAPQVFDPLRRRLGTMPRSRGAPDAGPPPAAPAPDAGPREAPGRSAAADAAADATAAAPAQPPALDAGTPKAAAEPARPPPRKKKRR